MQTIRTLLEVYQKRGSEGLPLERVYRQLFNRELFLKGYGKIYRNFGAMTRGSTAETVDSMSVQKIDTIIGLLRMERYRWTPVRRTYIEKANGKMRPLGIPTWSDKLLQEVIRSLLEPYYEQRFSIHSHGFRPGRGCHTALNEIRRYWGGTIWFIEGDIKGCFDNIDHTILLDILRRSIQDNRLLNLISGLLKAGYLEDWKYYRDTLSGTPQGGIISPLLSNIYLNELDRFVEDTLIPEYTKGGQRKRNLEYTRLQGQRKYARETLDFDKAKRITKLMRSLPSGDPADPDFRRLHYVRYADDFLLGFSGPKQEAESIRQQIGKFLEEKLKLSLSLEKTLVTHAVDEKAKFLGYEINVAREGVPIVTTGKSGRRAASGSIMLWVPKAVVQKYRERYSRKGKVVHRSELTPDSDYTIVQRYQSVNRGLYNYYCMAINVGKRIGRIQGILKQSLVKTLAFKYKTKRREIIKRYTVTKPEGNVLQAVLKRKKKSLVAEFGGFSLKRIPDGMGVVDFTPSVAWYRHANKRSEVVLRMLAGKCELCGKEGPVEVHHIRKLADIDKPGRRPKAVWEKIMSARKRKTLVVCSGPDGCHRMIHDGRYDGPSLKEDSLESRMP